MKEYVLKHSNDQCLCFKFNIKEDDSILVYTGETLVVPFVWTFYCGGLPMDKLSDGRSLWRDLVSRGWKRVK